MIATTQNMIVYSYFPCETSPIKSGSQFQLQHRPRAFDRVVEICVIRNFERFFVQNRDIISPAHLRQKAHNLLLGKYTSRTIAVPSSKRFECFGMILAISTELCWHETTRLEDVRLGMQ